MWIFGSYHRFVGGQHRGFLILTLRPKYVTGLIAVGSGQSGRVHEYGDHQEGGCGPSRKAYASRNYGGAIFGCGNGVTYGYVPIGRKYGQENRAGKLQKRKKKALVD